VPVKDYRGGKRNGDAAAAGRCEDATAGESSPSEAQKPADEKAQAARLDRLGWWNVLNTMDPFTRLFTDDLLAKLDKALSEHPDEFPLEDMKRFAVEFATEPRVSPPSCWRTSRTRVAFLQTAGRHRVRDVGIRCATL
jgi:hypothetical protein